VNFNPAQIPFHLFHSGWTRLAVNLQSALCIVDPKPVRLRALEYLRQGARLRAMHWLGEQDYPVYVINRSKDTERMSRFAESCRKWGISYERVEAINCADPEFDFSPYEAQIAETFYGKTQFLRGAVGCFLSHVKAWRKIIEANIPGAIICEDDARFLGPIPRKIADYNFPNDSDLIFVNQRTATGIQNLSNHSTASSFDFFQINDAILYLLDACSAISAIGTDGYIISCQGAEKLLLIFQKAGISMEVDWFLFFHSLSQAERKKFISIDGTGRFDMLEFRSEKLNTYVILPSFVEQRSNDSTIGFENPKNYIDRKLIRS
jgi:GR25 family glycosyltransferase involved in LPS biosynthesis